VTLAVFLHILGAAIWAGGLIFVGLTAGAARRTIPERELVEFFRVLGTGFLILAGIAATLLLISGNILIEDLFGGWGKLGESSSGELVLWKTALFVAVLFLALVHALILGPRIRRLTSAPPERGDETTRAGALRRTRILSGLTQAAMLAGTIAILALAADLIT
jgi:putative copper export protein